MYESNGYGYRPPWITREEAYYPEYQAMPPPYPRYRGRGSRGENGGRDGAPLNESRERWLLSN